MFETKPYRSPEGNESKRSTDEQKGQSPKTKMYQGKKTRNKTQVPELESKTYFKGLCSDLEFYIFELGKRASGNFDRTQKELEQYFGVTYSDSYQPEIMTETPEIMNKTPETFPIPEIPTIILDTGAELPKKDR